MFTNKIASSILFVEKIKYICIQEIELKEVQNLIFIKNQKLLTTKK